MIAIGPLSCLGAKRGANRSHSASVSRDRGGRPGCLRRRHRGSGPCASRSKILLVMALAVVDRDRLSNGTTAKPEAAVGCRQALSVGGRTLLLSERAQRTTRSTLHALNTARLGLMTNAHPQRLHQISSLVCRASGGVRNALADYDESKSLSLAPLGSDDREAPRGPWCGSRAIHLHAGRGVLIARCQRHPARRRLEGRTAGH